jgi:hypothetical protein
MRRILIVIFLVSTLQILASDNIVYLRQNNGTWKLGLKNGATATTVLEKLSSSGIETPLKDKDSNYIVFTGDFNGDGRKEIGYLYNNFLGQQNIRVYADNSDSLIYWTHLVDFNTEGTILYAFVLDYNGDGTDELGVIYQDVDGTHTTLKIPHLGYTQPFVYTFLLDRTEGTFRKALAGDFNGDGKDEVTIVYDDIDGTHTTFRVKNLYNNTEILYYTFLMDRTEGTFLKSFVGDFNGDGKDDIGILYNTSSGNYLDLRIRRLDTGANIASKHLFSRLTNELQDIAIGDYNGDGKDDIGIVYWPDFSDSIKFLVPSMGNTNPLFSGALFYSDNLYISSIAGDFNGDGSDEFGVLYADNNNHYKLKVPNLNNFSTDIINVTLTTASNDYFKRLVRIGPSAKIMSKVLDRTFTPIKSDRTTSGVNTFPVGWYNHASPTDATDIKNHLISNYLLTAWEGGVGTEVTGVRTDTTIIENNGINSKHIVSLSYGNYKSNAVKFNSDFNLLQINEARYTIGGYYIGDDLLGQQRDPNTGFSWVNFTKFYDTIHCHSNKFTLAADASPNFTEIAEECQTLNKVPFDIPLLEEYIYKYDDTTQSRIFYSLANIPTKVEELRKLTTKFNLPGLIYIPQGHGERWRSHYGYFNKPYCDQRPASWKESRYDVFNAIVHGAGGIIFWAYFASDTVDWTTPPYYQLSNRQDYMATTTTYYNQNVVQNLNSISQEIASGSSFGISGSLHSALVNGPINGCKVFCSKDGYDGDYDYWYVGRENYDISGTYPQAQKGQGIADINYIVRGDNNTYYIIAVNNSKDTVKQVRFYIPASYMLSGYKIFSTMTSNVGTPTAYEKQNSSDTLWKKGTKYYAITDTFPPFGVKIYKIGTTGTYTLSKSNSGFVSADTKVKSFELYNCYPNPFNPSTTFSFNLPEKLRVSLKIFDALGREVSTLISEEIEQGKHSITWNARNFASGVYFYRLDAGAYTKTKKFVLLK